MARITIDTRDIKRVKDGMQMFIKSFRQLLTRDLKTFFDTRGRFYMQTIVRREFKTKGMGTWAPPSPITLLRRSVSGKPFEQMIDTSELFRKMTTQIRASNKGVTLTVGGKKAIQNHFGATIQIPAYSSSKPLAIFKTQKEAKWGKNFTQIPGGYIIYRKTAKPHSVTIPARPLFQFRDIDVKIVGESLSEYMTGRLRMKTVARPEGIAG